MTEKISERIDDVVHFPPKVKIPRVSSTDAATQVLRDLVEALKNPTPNAPLEEIHDTHHTALRHLAELFNIVTK